MRTRHYSPHIVRQQVVVRQRGQMRRHGRGQSDRNIALRQRVTKAFASTYGGQGKLHHHRPLRPGAILTPDQLWQVYIMCGDVRAAVDSITRRISTQDWRVVPTADPAEDRGRYEAGLEQAVAVTEALMEPNEDDDWREFVTKVSLDTLVQYHGAIELAYKDRLLGRGFIEEFATPFGATIHPIASDTGRVLGYVQEKRGPNGYFGAGDDRNGLLVLSKEQIALMRLYPNTLSQYAVPIIETIVREVTTLVRASERTMYTMDRHEVPTGFLILTGMPPKTEDAVKESATHSAGRDDSIRILHTMGATSPAQWLRVQEDFKEIQYQPVIRESRHVIWRNFGVTPIEMGDDGDKTRASSSAQLEVGDSHLVEPFLEAWTRLVNKRMVPPLVERYEGSIRAETLCKFEFVRDESLSPEDEKLRAEAAEVRLKSGQTTLNEERAAEGRPRYSEGGDTARVNGEPIGDVEVEDDDPDDDGSVGDDAEVMGRCGDHCDHGDRPHAVHLLLSGFDTAVQERALTRRQRELLPSDWQPEGRFSDVRTMDLSALFDQVILYRADLQPFWDAAKREVVAATAAADRAGTVGSSDHLQKVGASIDALREQWSAATRQRYIDTAQLGAEGARDITGDKTVGGNAETQGLAYFEQAMTFLNSLMDDLRTRVTANIAAVRTAQARAPQKADPGLGPESDLEDLLSAIEGTFDSNEFRIDNWSGRLVENGNLAVVAAVLEASAESDREPGSAEVVEPVEEEPISGEDAADTDPGSRGNEWWVQWVAVNDEGTCLTCELESALGLRRASTLTTVPGGRTECRARCRCVLVWWTRAEVDSGDAILL